MNLLNMSASALLRIAQEAAEEHVLEGKRYPLDEYVENAVYHSGWVLEPGDNTWTVLHNLAQFEVDYRVGKG